MSEEANETSADTDVAAMLDPAHPIPFKFIGWQTYNSLARKLDPFKTLNGNDWRMLADKLGYSSEDILKFESNQSQHGSNTIKVLTDYSHSQDSSVNNLYTALETIQRPDALEELKNSLPEIYKKYRESFLKKKHDLMTENECSCSSCGANMSCPNEKFTSFCCEQKKFMDPLNNCSMMMNSHLHHVPMGMVNKQYQRHKSVDNALLMGEMASRIHGYERPSPEFKRMRSVPLPDSMVVRGHDSRSQFFCAMEPMDHVPTMREEPVSAARVMMRQQYNHLGIPSSMSGICHRNDYESSYRPPMGQRTGLKLEISNAMDGYKHQIQDNFCSPSPTPNTPSTPLDHLTKLANEKKFQPDDTYDNRMRIKQEEEMCMSKPCHMYPQYDNVEKSGNGITHPMQGTCQGIVVREKPVKLEENGSHPKLSEPPNTFPLRLKSSSSSSNSTQLSKSASLPDNMKPEFRKAFGHIKVFVTYADDDKKHVQRVINLCNCLRKNGFTCCVDMSSKSLQEDPYIWCLNRFNEADFIVVVMSHKYRMEADSCEMDNDADDSDTMDEDDRRLGSKSFCLQTKQIYRLMYREYLQNNHKPGRFVPLLFQGMSDDLIPEWMMYAYSKLVYVWPVQYKDLLWMLTKPEDRVPEHIAPVINRSLHSNSEDKENGEALEVSQESE